MSKKPVIKYTNRSFDSIKESLLEHAKRFYPDQYNDFSDSSFGSLMFDSVAYIGDIMSFYLDFQMNESMLETAIQYGNIRKMAEEMGYKYYGRPSAYGRATFYIRVPANSTAPGPDVNYIPILKKNSQFQSSAGANFILLEDVNFNDSNVEVVASKYDDSTGKATEYAMRSYGRVRSGAYFTTTISVPTAETFQKIRIGPSVVNEVVSVVDTEGHRYYQVDYLTQDVVYLETTNPRAAQDGVSSILKPFAAARRFTVEQDSEGTYLQFGYGSDDETVVKDVTDPRQVVLKTVGRNYITDSAFDPNALLGTDKLGINPSNTTLTVVYGSNTQQNVSVGISELNGVSDALMEFPNNTNPTGTTFESVFSSLECSNDEIIAANTSLPTSDELRYRAYAVKAAQNRIVTKNDYEAYCYLMPPSLGSVKRAGVVNDPSGTNRRVSLYVISENRDGELVQSNQSIKANLKTWLQKNKMLNDSIDILDSVIINFGFSYEAIVDPNLSTISVLADVDRRLRSLFQNKMYIGEPLYINQIYNTINKTIGIIDTVKVDVEIKNGVNYSPISIDISDIMSKDGSYIKTPKNCILELKFPNSDITGMAV